MVAPAPWPTTLMLVPRNRVLVSVWVPAERLSVSPLAARATARRAESVPEAVVTYSCPSTTRARPAPATSTPWVIRSSVANRVAMSISEPSAPSNRTFVRSMPPAAVRTICCWVAAPEMKLFPAPKVTVPPVLAGRKRL